MQSNPLPDRIEPDAIVEALVEFRFEHTELPEAVVGRLLDASPWADYSQFRLPTADIPQPLRESQPNLKYLPIIELRNSTQTRIAKIGGHVCSYHILPPYPGWTAFEQELSNVTTALVDKLKSIGFSRLGFRYINVLRPDDHHVSGFADTNINVVISGEALTSSLNVNYNRVFDSNHIVTVKVSTPDFVIGPLRPGYSLLCDIDVASKPEHAVAGLEATSAWLKTAHGLEKAEFFTILPDRITEQLRVKEENAHE
jgi:uncharacterized protein (TIGR04255 family)